ncbi:MAG: outer membrane protein assembly factor BamD [Bacteroidaceae bacterium]|nr:outer membrane protein assembly factor BamD [Bacteroidaceae bacterium]
MSRLIYILVLSVLTLFVSCGNYNKVLKSTDVDFKFAAAKEYYAKGQYNRAATILQMIVTSLKGTEYGQESLFLLGMSHFKAENYEAATAVFRKFYQSYPKGEYTEEARFHTALSLMAEIPEPKLDQSATYEAITEFQNFVEVYPNSVRREEAMAHIYYMEDVLVEKEYLSAKLYYDLGDYFGNCNSGDGGSNYQACIITAENAIRDYPYTALREKFAILILKAKFELAEKSIEAKKLERYHNAIDEYYGFTNEYPESTFMQEATKMYEKARKYAPAETEN